MSNTTIQLIADGKISEEDLSSLLLALDKRQSPKIQEVIADFDSISNEHLLKLINATHQASLTNLKLAFTMMDRTFARSLMEAAMANLNIARCWLLLGTHHLYYREGKMADLNDILQLDFARCVTIDCETMTAAQVTQLAERINNSNTLELTLTIDKMDQSDAQRLIELLTPNQKLSKLSLTLNGTATTINRDAEEDLVQTFAGLMQAVRSDVAEVSSTATAYASGLLGQGRAFLSAFTAPLAACTQPSRVNDDLLSDIPPPNEEAKKALGKYA